MILRISSYAARDLKIIHQRRLSDVCKKPYIPVSASVLCHLGGSTGRAGWRSEAGRQFPVDSARASSGYGNAAEYSTADEYPHAAADRLGESADLAVQCSRAELNKPTLRG